MRLRLQVGVKVCAGFCCLRQQPAHEPSTCKQLTAWRPKDSYAVCYFFVISCRFCWLCQELAHEPTTCQQLTAWRQALAAFVAAADSRTEDWMGCNTRHCPGCRARVQKNGGCNHMTCKVC
jgi:hypothetical protein